MRWPRLWRRRRGAAPASSFEVSGFRPGGWAEIVHPPTEASTSIADLPEPSAATVKLGFVDGSSVTLDEESGDVAALRTLAGTLVTRDESDQDR